MGENKFKQRRMETQIEEHSTAAWFNIAAMKRGSRVFQPTDFDVEAAKEWVEQNQK